jgi:hypothetical protein
MQQLLPMVSASADAMTCRHGQGRSACENLGEANTDASWNFLDGADKANGPPPPSRCLRGMGKLGATLPGCTVPCSTSALCTATYGGMKLKLVSTSSDWLRHCRVQRVHTLETCPLAASWCLELALCWRKEKPGINLAAIDDICCTIDNWVTLARAFGLHDTATRVGHVTASRNLLGLSRKLNGRGKHADGRVVHALVAPTPSSIWLAELADRRIVQALGARGFTARRLNSSGSGTLILDVRKVTKSEHADGPVVHVLRAHGPKWRFDVPWRSLGCGHRTTHVSNHSIFTCREATNSSTPSPVVTASSDDGPWYGTRSVGSDVRGESTCEQVIWCSKSIWSNTRGQCVVFLDKTMYYCLRLARESARIPQPGEAKIPWIGWKCPICLSGAVLVDSLKQARTTPMTYLASMISQRPARMGLSGAVLVDSLKQARTTPMTYLASMSS